MNYYDQIKGLLISNEIYKKIKDYSKNKNDLDTYYNVGKILVEAQGGEERAKYGDNLIKEYSNKLTIELGKGYSTRSLKLMRKFYLFQKGQAVPALFELSWSHIVELLSLKDINEINYYINITIHNNLGYRKLSARIKSNEYDRLPESAKVKHINNETCIIDYIKNLIVIKSYKEVLNEKVLQQVILEDIPSFLEELGNGFTFIKNEYPIKLGERYNYIDLLLFNIEYNCYVVVELKVTELKKEHIGQIEVYMNYIDNNLKKINHNRTIGLIIVRENNEYIIKYSSDERIIARKYKLI